MKDGGAGIAPAFLFVVGRVEIECTPEPAGFAR